MANYIKEEVLKDEEAPMEDMTLEVTIPESSSAGDKITIECPNKSYVQFVTPENVVAGDTVHVVVNESDQNELVTEKASSTTSYQGVAAVTTGVIVSSFVIGPIVTGVLVVGMVVCATQRKKSQTNTSAAEETKSVELMEEGNNDENLTQTETTLNKDEISSEPETREQKIAAALVKTADYIVDKVSALDDRLAISGNTLKAIATIQEIDERNKISETVLTNIKKFDEKYTISQTAGNVVTTTITKAKELDESCNLTENLTNTGSNLALCMTDFERRYDISTRITTAFLVTMTTVTEVITQYLNRITTTTSTTDISTGNNENTMMEGVAESFPTTNEDNFNTLEIGGAPLAAAVEVEVAEPENEDHDSQNPDLAGTGSDTADTITTTAVAV